MRVGDGRAVPIPLTLRLYHSSAQYSMGNRKPVDRGVGLLSKRVERVASPDVEAEVRKTTSCRELGAGQNSATGIRLTLGCSGAQIHVTDPHSPPGTR